MSEKIKITIVTDDEKLNNAIDDFGVKSVIVTHNPSMTIMSTLLKNSLMSGNFCGGRGDCGRCRIQFLEGMTAPTPLERSILEAEELRQGYRLACLAKPKNDCVIKLALLDAPKTSVVTEMIDVTGNTDCLSHRKAQSKNNKSDVTDTVGNRKSINVPGQTVGFNQEQSDNKRTDVIITVDLGTTTIAMQLMEPDTGRVIDTYCEMNPQRQYGADVLSRIQASCEGSREALQKIVLEVLEQGVARFRKRNTALKCMCIAGNTTMQHLLMGYDVSSLGKSPFTPVEIGLQEYKHPSWDFPVWLVPGISAFVGGDIVAGLYACNMLPVLTESTAFEDMWAGLPGYIENITDDFVPTLLIDLGTNGEMAITDGVRMIVTATAAGPAFEGGAGAGIIGSDMIACIAELLRQGIVDETGLLAEPYFSKGISVQNMHTGEYKHDSAQDDKSADKKNYVFMPGKSGQSLYLTQKDIRSLQTAKAAVRAGVEILLKRMEEEQTDEVRLGKPQASVRQDAQVYLAGGFGYYLDVDAAFRIGLLPEHMRGHVRAVGNTSLAGAYLIGRDLWQHKIEKQTLEKSLSSIVSINLAKQEEFERLYIQYMNFELQN